VQVCTISSDSYIELGHVVRRFAQLVPIHPLNLSMLCAVLLYVRLRPRDDFFEKDSSVKEIS